MLLLSREIFLSDFGEVDFVISHLLGEVEFPADVLGDLVLILLNLVILLQNLMKPMFKLLELIGVREVLGVLGEDGGGGVVLVGG